MKHLTLLTLLVFAAPCWATCVEGDCVNGKGKYIFADGRVYEGNFVGGVRSGKGKARWTDGVVYEGDFKHNSRNGKGKLTFADGRVYEGDFVAGMKSGKGKLTWADGQVYEGDWKNNQITGVGKITFADGHVQDGVFQDGTYLGTVASVEREKKQRLAELEQARIARVKVEKIYNACLLDKSSGLDMQVNSIEAAVKATCEAIAEDPSWMESLKYD